MKRYTQTSVLLSSVLLFSVLLFSVLLLTAGTANAHFPWLTIEDGKATYFFGEDPADRTYKLPPTIAKAEITMRSGAEKSAVETKMIESDKFIGKQSVAVLPGKVDLISQTIFGVYNGAKLQYYTQHLGGVMPTRFSACKPIKGMDLQAHAVNTESGVDIYVLWQGKPLADAEVTLFCDEGHQEGDGTTGKDGKVSFTDKEVEEGINGIMVGHTLAGDSGRVGDQEYDSAMHYLTATFADPEDK
ncbi:MAG: DUF4198 domain-containing protein [Planctomycetaceae bacterium]|nr:DUF4198 domain-containing protein [Planctomycetaceae bacterium]